MREEEEFLKQQQLGRKSVKVVNHQRTRSEYVLESLSAKPLEPFLPMPEQQEKKTKPKHTRSNTMTTDLA